MTQLPASCMVFSIGRVMMSLSGDVLETSRTFLAMWRWLTSSNGLSFCTKRRVGEVWRGFTRHCQTRAPTPRWQHVWWAWLSEQRKPVIETKCENSAFGYFTFLLCVILYRKQTFVVFVCQSIHCKRRSQCFDLTGFLPNYSDCEISNCSGASVRTKKPSVNNFLQVNR